MHSHRNMHAKWMLAMIIVAMSTIANSQECALVDVATATGVHGKILKSMSSPAVPDTVLLLVKEERTPYGANITIVKQKPSPTGSDYEPVCHATFVMNIGRWPVTLAANGDVIYIDSFMNGNGPDARVQRFSPQQQAASGSPSSVPMCNSSFHAEPIVNWTWNADAYTAILESTFDDSSSDLAAVGIVRNNVNNSPRPACLQITGNTSTLVSECITTPTLPGMTLSFAAVSPDEFLAGSLQGLLLMKSSPSSPDYTNTFVSVVGGAAWSGNRSLASVASVKVTAANRAVLGLTQDWEDSCVAVGTAYPGISAITDVAVIRPLGGVNSSWESVNITSAVIPNIAALNDLRAGGFEVTPTSGGLLFVGHNNTAKTFYLTSNCTALTDAELTSASSAPDSGSHKSAVVPVIAVLGCLVAVAVGVVAVKVTAPHVRRQHDRNTHPLAEKPSLPKSATVCNPLPYDSAEVHIVNHGGIC